MEENKRLSFLDVTVIRENYTFEPALFRKNTFTNLGLTYLSYELIKYKINAIYRAFNLSSNYNFFNNEVPFLSKIILKRMLFHQIYFLIM